MKNPTYHQYKAGQQIISKEGKIWEIYSISSDKTWMYVKYPGSNSTTYVKVWDVKFADPNIIQLSKPWSVPIWPALDWAFAGGGNRVISSTVSESWIIAPRAVPPRWVWNGVKWYYRWILKWIEPAAKAINPTVAKALAAWIFRPENLWPNTTPDQIDRNMAELTQMEDNPIMKGLLELTDRNSIKQYVRANKAFFRSAILKQTAPNTYTADFSILQLIEDYHANNTQRENMDMWQQRDSLLITSIWLGDILEDGTSVSVESTSWTIQNHRAMSSGGWYIPIWQWSTVTIEA